MKRIEIKLWEGTTMDYFYFFVVANPEELWWVEVKYDVDDDVEQLRKIGLEVVKDEDGREVSTWIGDGVTGEGHMLYLCRKTGELPQQLPDFILNISKYQGGEINARRS